MIKSVVIKVLCTLLIGSQVFAGSLILGENNKVCAQDITQTIGGNQCVDVYGTCPSGYSNFRQTVDTIPTYESARTGNLDSLLLDIPDGIYHNFADGGFTNTACIRDSVNGIIPHATTEEIKNTSVNSGFDVTSGSRGVFSFDVTRACIGDFRATESVSRSGAWGCCPIGYDYVTANASNTADAQSNEFSACCIQRQGIENTGFEVYIGGGRWQPGDLSIFQINRNQEHTYVCLGQDQGGADAPLAVSVYRQVPERFLRATNETYKPFVSGANNNNNTILETTGRDVVTEIDIDTNLDGVIDSGNYLGKSILLGDSGAVGINGGPIRGYPIGPAWLYNTNTSDNFSVVYNGTPPEGGSLQCGATFRNGCAIDASDNVVYASSFANDGYTTTATNMCSSCFAPGEAIGVVQAGGENALRLCIGTGEGIGSSELDNYLNENLESASGAPVSNDVPLYVDVALVNNSVQDTVAFYVESTTTGSTNADVLANCRAQGGIYTALGCLDVTPVGVITGLIRIALGVMSGVVLVQLMIVGLIYQSGLEENIEKAREIIISTSTGTALIVFSVLILRVIGIDVLDVLPEGFF